MATVSELCSSSSDGIRKICTLACNRKYALHDVRPDRLDHLRCSEPRRRHEPGFLHVSRWRCGAPLHAYWERKQSKAMAEDATKKSSEADMQRALAKAKAELKAQEAKAKAEGPRGQVSSDHVRPLRATEAADHAGPLESV
jgi:hypothetical protein